MNLLKVKIRKDLKKYFVSHQMFLKIFHGPSVCVWNISWPIQKPFGSQHPPTPTPFYILNVQSLILSKFILWLVVCLKKAVTSKTSYNIMSCLKLCWSFPKCFITFFTCEGWKHMYPSKVAFYFLKSISVIVLNERIFPFQVVLFT